MPVKRLKNGRGDAGQGVPQGSPGRLARMLPAAAILLAAPFAARAADEAASQPLRLCADPTNMPFSSSKPGQPGLYVELGNAIAQALHRPVTMVWEMTYYGKHATRETLLAGKCDMDIGLPVDVGFMGRSMVFSHAFLQEGFALVTAKSAPVTLSALRGKRVAVQLATPPQSVVAAHDDITGATFLDPDSAVQALADGRVDAAFVWGPSAGYLNHVKLGDRFAVTPVSGEGMQYNIGVGFARKQTALRDQVDAALPSLAGTVTQLAAKYGFPAARPIALSQAETPAPLVQTAALTRLVVDHPAPAPVVQAAAMVQTTDDQKDAADRVAGNAGAADLGFKPASGPQAVAEGRTIFNGTCNHCHGPDAEQSVRKIDLRLLQHRYGGAMDQVFHYTVTHGRESKGMPNWSGVFSEDDFSKILAFLHSVQTPSTN